MIDRGNTEDGIEISIIRAGGSKKSDLELKEDNLKGVTTEVQSKQRGDSNGKH